MSSDGPITFTNGLRIIFDSTSGVDQVAAVRFSDIPRDVSGISESNVSDYRVVIVAGSGLSFSDQTEVHFRASDFPGINTPSAVTVYSRQIPNNGSFSALTTS